MIGVVEVVVVIVVVLVFRLVVLDVEVMVVVLNFISALIIVAGFNFKLNVNS